MLPQPRNAPSADVMLSNNSGWPVGVVWAALYTMYRATRFATSTSARAFINHIVCTRNNIAHYANTFYRNHVQALAPTTVAHLFGKYCINVASRRTRGAPSVRIFGAMSTRIGGVCDR